MRVTYASSILFSSSRAIWCTLSKELFFGKPSHLACRYFKKHLHMSCLLSFAKELLNNLMAINKTTGNCWEFILARNFYMLAWSPNCICNYRFLVLWWIWSFFLFGDGRGERSVIVDSSINVVLPYFCLICSNNKYWDWLNI